MDQSGVERIWGDHRHKSNRHGDLMFRGLYEHSVDAKGRTSLPVRIRESLAGGEDSEVRFILTTGLDPCLVLYRYEEWQELEEKLAGLSQFDPAVVRVRRLYIAGATDCTLDKNGRLLIPPMLREHAGLKKDAVWAGMGKTVELWAKERWHLQMEAARANPQAISEALAGVGL